MITIDAAKHYGAYVVRGSTVYVRSSYGMKSRELRESPPRPRRAATFRA